MVESFVWLFAALLIAERLFELWLAGRNRKILLAAGAVESGKAHYPAIVVFHSAWMIAWIWEALARGPALHTLWLLWLILFLGGEILRYWCMYTLGPFWNTRILTLPGHRRITSGPYRMISHPNYVGVAVFIFAVPMVFNAWVTAFTGSLLNLLLLLLIRIPAEERALKQLEAKRN
jgi:methyltransferase